MIKYNLYYKNVKVNRFPLNDNEVNEVLKNEFIYKKLNNNDIEKIPVNKMRIIKCTII